jgi:hypothetical protein
VLVVMVAEVPVAGSVVGPPCWVPGPALHEYHATLADHARPVSPNAQNG